METWRQDTMSPAQTLYNTTRKLLTLTGKSEVEESEQQVVGEVDQHVGRMLASFLPSQTTAEKSQAYTSDLTNTHPHHLQQKPKRREGIKSLSCG
ncbi:hypothetical protein E2C01_055051 [Portunus trituberculatus]|uniref:Uncharacterized protein n=1 Tax=Portunus trituberculatus TaxID=210409 RepID=A0A5B7GTS8_PORTR|nr:hypothetical protein [Portunus trituberculatus]